MKLLIRSPVDCVIFDCDSTLSTIEGVDYLAQLNHVADIVKAKTEKFMSLGGMNVTSYAERLQLIKPSKIQCQKLGQQYYNNITPQAADVIRILHHLEKKICIVSAGVQPSVGIFSAKLGLSESNVHAVTCYFDDDGNYRDFDRTSPLVLSAGKRVVVEKLTRDYSNTIYVGDGQNDLAAYPLVDCFIGFGGVVHRQVMAEAADYYITHSTLAVLLPLILMPQEVSQLNHEDQAIYQIGLQLLAQL